MANILVIRHSRTIANEQGILMGAKFESPLSSEGKYIAEQKGKTLLAQGFQPDRVYTSELGRAKQTADIILKQLGLKTTRTELEGLNERDFGIHDGKPYKSVLDALAKYGENPPTIEPVADFVARLTAAWEQIKQETTGTTLVITHSSPEKYLRGLALDPKNAMQYWESPDAAYCEGFSFTY